MTPKTWIGVACREHVLRGINGSFAQLCHGKQAALARMHTGDTLIYYSPTARMGEGPPLKAFTALGRVSGDGVYRFDMGNGFVPHRRDIAYDRAAHDVPLAALSERLHFVTQNKSWGMLARRGHFEIDAHDAELIAAAMRSAR